MADFKPQHELAELIKLLGKPEKSEVVLKCSDILSRQAGPSVSTKNATFAALQKLEGSSSSAQTVVEKYKSLKERNVREVDSVVYLLSEIASDEKTKAFLKKNTEDIIAKQSKQCFEEKSKAAAADGIHEKKEVSSEDVATRKFAQSSSDDARRSEFRTHSSTSVKSSSDKKREDSKEISQLTYTKTTKDTIPHRFTPFGVSRVHVLKKERPYSTWDFGMDVPMDNYKGGAVGLFPVSVQEYKLIEDLLFCLGGIEGTYIMTQHPGDPCEARTFAIDETTDPSLRELVKRILPICSHYSTVMRFIEEKSQYECGLVNHSLAAAMRHLSKDYFVLIAQLEHQSQQQNLSLQKLWFYIQPALHYMEVLATVANTVNKGKCFGGTVLSILHERATSLTGNTKAQEVCLYLTQSACVPYFEMLEKWIYKGVISDHYKEFFVESNDLLKKEDVSFDYSDDYWNKNYTVKRDLVPVFLERVAEKILKTGKYMNVIRQCRRSIKMSDEAPLVYSVVEREYTEKIEAAYNFASKALLDLLMEGSDLMGKLRSVKHYFLMDQGDFIVQFLDMAEEELAKKVDEIMPTRLESLLELSLRTSVVSSDKYKDSVRIELLPRDLLSQMSKILLGTGRDKDESDGYSNTMTGLECFAFDYDVEWPLNLVLNRSVLSCYQMLFRYLLYCKHVERLLGKVWVLNKVAKAFSINTSTAYTAAFSLRQRMLNFIQNLEYYTFFEIIEPNWHIFQTKMLEVRTIDEVLKCHAEFIDTCLLQCMLTSPTLLTRIYGIFQDCVDFANYMQNTQKYAMEAEATFLKPVKLEPVDDEKEKRLSEIASPVSENFSFHQHIQKYQKNFDKAVSILLRSIVQSGHSSCGERLVDMLHRLDFNGFYSATHEAFLATNVT